MYCIFTGCKGPLEESPQKNLQGSTKETLESTKESLGENTKETLENTKESLGENTKENLGESTKLCPGRGGRRVLRSACGISQSIGQG